MPVAETCPLSVKSEYSIVLVDNTLAGNRDYAGRLTCNNSVEIVSKDLNGVSFHSRLFNQPERNSKENSSNNTCPF